MNKVPDSPSRRLHRWASRYLYLGSIKGKIFIVFVVTFLSIGALTALNFWNLSTVKGRMLLSERYDDLLNNILEVRRFEKNFLIYGDHASLTEGREYLGRIDTLVDELAGDLPLVAGEEAYAEFRRSLGAYEAMVDGIGAGATVAPEGLRVLGKRITDAADRFRRTKRERIHRALLRTSILPFAFLGIFLLLMVLVIKLISYGLLKPLDVVMDTTQRVARGDFSPILYEGERLEEISGLIEAFNRMALELETNQEDLLQARKIAAIGTFTAGVAHELNNPINNIALSAESFVEDYGDRVDDEGREMLRDILGQADRAADIVKNLLDFSRTEKPAFNPLAPEQVVSSSINLVKNQFRIAGVRLETEVAPGLPEIRGNLRNLQQVFTNLLLNAVQATPQGGQVTFAVRPAEDPAFVRFTVRDTGSGIPADIRQQIFEPFFSTKEVGKGTGLGLAVSYSLVKRHGGRIEVAGEEGLGAEFTVLLPAASEDDARNESMREEA